MHTPYGHLTYCTNIHSGESWPDHFASLQQHIPLVKENVCADRPFGIGLRLSNRASIELYEEKVLREFQQWLKEHDCYVFTINGFPYGGFHQTRVKDNVHQPDWTTQERVDYTIRLAHILAALLPDGMDGGISTSPLSYRYWHTQEDLPQVVETATQNVLQVVQALMQIQQATGKYIHLDIEPEPDGLLGYSAQFFRWYEHDLLPAGISLLHQHNGLDIEKAEAVIKQYVCLCYDICHFAITYEDHAAIVQKLKERGIKTGKIQISAALKALLGADSDLRKQVVDAFQAFNESTYLHQVVALQTDGEFRHYPDLPQALAQAGDLNTLEWRAHFHVPLFVQDYGLLQSTQHDIQQLLSLHMQQPFTGHLEIETYTWDVLPEALKLPMNESIVRELKWVLRLFEKAND